MTRSHIIVVTALLLAGVAAGWILLVVSVDGDTGLAALGGRPAAPRGPDLVKVAEDVRDSLRAAPGQPEALASPTAEPAATAGLPPDALRLIGRVARVDGTAVAGAEVLLAQAADAESLARAVSTRTLGDGSFRLELPGADARRHFDRDEWLVLRHVDTDLALRQLQSLAAGERDVGLIVLSLGAGVRGRVIAPDGTPAKGALVRVRTLKDDGRGQGYKLEHYDLEEKDDDVRDALETLRALRTGPDGTFVFAGLHEGEAQVDVDSPSARRVELGGLPLAAGAVVDVGDVALDEGLVIAGIVLTAAGEPAHASIRVQRERPPASEVDGSIKRTGQDWADQWTDETGRFRVAGLARGTYELVTQANDHACTVVMVQAGDDDVTVRLLEAATVLLELSDAHTGEPVLQSDISVKADLRLANGSTLGVGNRVHVTHGEEARLPPGTWRVTGLAHLPATLLIDAPGYSPARLELPPLAPGTTLAQRLCLERPLRLLGFVVDDSAHPIAEAVVQIAPTAGPSVGLPTKMARTDADGVFALDGLGQGTWSIFAYADGFVGQASGSVEFVNQDLAGLALQLVEGATLSGTALTARGDNVPDARVAAWLVRPLPSESRTVPEATRVIEVAASQRHAHTEARTEAEGAYRLGPLIPGEYLVAAALPADGELPARLRGLAEAQPSDVPLPVAVVGVVVGAGEDRSLDLILPRPARVRGVVRSGGAPAIGAHVALLTGSRSTWTLVRAVDADAGGAFEIDELPPVDGVVLATADSEVLPRLQRVRLTEGADVVVDVSFDGPGVAGTVVDAARNRPVGGVPVFASLSKPAESQTDPWFGLAGSLSNLLAAAKLTTSRATSDAAGRFTLSHLAAGTWFATAYGNGWLATQQITFEVVPDWTPDDIELHVKSGAVVEGSVRWSLGGLADAELEIGLYKPVENTVAGFVRASRGTYRLAGLLPGDYELRVRHMVGGGGYVHAQPVTLTEGQHVTLDLVIDD